jgi:hypothetical protein
MNFNDIRSKAKNLGISTHRMKKPELIQTIQRTENNMDCFGTHRVNHCGEENCLWRPDCLSLNRKK